MSRKDKPASCLAVFLKSWLLTAAALSAATAALVAAGIRWLDWNQASWTQVSGWTSYPVLSALAIAMVATLIALLAGTLFGAASLLLSRRSSSRTSSSRVSRPQSQRKTTV